MSDVLDVPRPDWMSEDVVLLADAADKFFGREIAPDYDGYIRDGVVAKSAWRKTGAAGLLCAAIPEDYGGAGGTFAHEAVITRYVTGGAEGAETLYVHAGGRYVCEEGVCHLLDRTAAEQGILIASEPLSQDPGWQAVPVNHLLVVREGLEVEVSPL